MVSLILAIAISFAAGSALVGFLYQQQAKRQQQVYQDELQRMKELLEKELELQVARLHRDLEAEAKKQAIADFNQAKEQLEKTFEDKYRFELEKWKERHEKTIRQSSLKISRNTIKGRVSEQILPLLPGLRYSPSEMRFIGNPIDYVIFEGYDAAKEGDDDIQAVVLADIKRGQRARLSPISTSGGFPPQCDSAWR